MAELIRDTTFGHLVRFVTRGRYLQFLEERDPELWKKYVNQEKSGHLAHHGNAQPQDRTSEDSDTKSLEGLGGIRTRDARERESETNAGSHASSQTRIPEEGANYNHASGIKIDPEKGRDLHVIDFLENDTEVCMETP
jgi:DHA1 family multidrug resistance protein-like MFS transporter